MADNMPLAADGPLAAMNGEVASDDTYIQRFSWIRLEDAAA
jgi:hypothetical protein